MISVRDLSCGYEGHQPLYTTSFDLREGEAMGILGANGSGKTTLFKTVLGDLKPLGGEISIDGKRLDAFKLRERARKLSYVPQAKSYSYDYTVEDVVLMGRSSKIGAFGSPKSEDIAAAHEALAELDLSEINERFYGELSGGQQQMVLIARAIAQEATYVVLDEPASNLDFKNQKLLLETIRYLKERGMGVLMATHTPDHLFSCFEHALLIQSEGGCVFGPVSEVITEESLSAAFGVGVLLADCAGRSSVYNKVCYLE